MKIKLTIISLIFILFCTSCPEFPTEGDEISIGHVDKLIYSFSGTVPITTVVARYGEVTVYGTVNLNRFASNWWAYVDYTVGTVRFVDSQHNSKLTPIYQIYKKELEDEGKKESSRL